MHVPDMQQLPTPMRVPLASIMPNPDNPRTITKAAFEKLVKSIAEDPEMLLYRPLVCVTNTEKGMLMPLGGNMRLQAIPAAIRYISENPSLFEGVQAERLAFLEAGVPVAIADHWDEEQRRRFVIKDNVSFGEWDWDRLANEWEAPKLEQWGLTIPDFKAYERAETVEDTYNSKLPEKCVTETGDLYELNAHRLRCGNSCSFDDIADLMNGRTANLCMTSPPYWVGKDYEISDTEQAIDKFIQDAAYCMAYAVSKDYGRIVINTGTSSINRIDKKRKTEILLLLDKWQNALREMGWLMRHLRMWVKHGQLPATISPKTDIIDQHNEFIAAFEQESSMIATFWEPDGSFRGQERLGTKWAQQGVWDDVKGEKSTTGKHNAGFPIEIPGRNLRLYTKPGELVYEPFCGSGTTLMAAEQLGRTCYAQDFKGGWCDETVRRWVAWMKMQGKPFTVLRNGKDITADTWLHEQS